MRQRSYAEFYALLKKLPLAEKDVLISQWTDGATTSLKEMSEKQYRAMIRGMRAMIDSNEDLRKLRSQVLRQLQIYGVNTTDWEEVDRFCKLPRIAGKRFCKLHGEELRSLLGKMRSINQKKREKATGERKRAALEAITEGQLPN